MESLGKGVGLTACIFVGVAGAGLFVAWMQMRALRKKIAAQGS